MTDDIVDRLRIGLVSAPFNEWDFDATEDLMEEAADTISRLRSRVEELEKALRAMLMEWDKFTRYGSPMAKGANKRVASARIALLGPGRPVPPHGSGP